MDRQQFDRKEIPVNARAVGTPMGMNLLYLEDYVHTFIKKLIKNDDEDNGCEVFLYGYEFDEDGTHFFIVSGAYHHESRYDRAEKIGQQYFPMSQYLGEATIHSDGISEMNMEIVREGARNIVLKNFYIYYDQNEDMQNYLIEWNLEHREYRSRNEREDAVRYGRIAQACNKEEVRVGFLWNAMNILSLGFIVCFMVYGIISINNYHKMRNMEDKLSYIVTTMTEGQNMVETSAALAEQPEPEKQEVFQTEIMEAVIIEESSAIPEVIIDEAVTEEEKNAVTQDVSTQETSMGELAESVVIKEASTTATIPQYYVVQQGDTLRSICISVYGSLDKVEEVCTQNGITNPDSILYGQTLLLP